jgi:hypothetical protein
MLYDPKWDKPSVAGFRAWLERQDQEATFDYNDCNRCAVGQYLISAGTSWHGHCTGANLVGELNVFAAAAMIAAYRRSQVEPGQRPARPTFGAVLREMDKAA